MAHEPLITDDLPKLNPGDPDLIKRVVDRWRIAQGEQDDWAQQAREAFSFYDGDQWTSKDLRELRDSGQPALTLNIIRPRIDSLVGLERQARTDIKAYAWEIGDDALADLASELIKATLVRELAGHTLSEQFKQGVIGGRGWIEVHVEDDLSVSVELEPDPSSVLIDPASRKVDLSDADYVIRERWVTFRFAKEKWPDKARELDVLGVDLGLTKDTSFAPFGFRHSKERLFEVDPFIRALESGEGVDPELVDAQSGLIRILEMWHRRTGKVYEIIAPDGSVLERRFDEKPTDEELRELGLGLRERMASQALRQGDLLNVVPDERPVPVTVTEEDQRLMYTTTVGGGIVLDHRVSPYRDMDFPWVPYFALVTKGIDRYTTRGLAFDMLDPQRLKNKARSQALNHLNRSTNSSWWVRKGSLEDTRLAAHQMSQAGSLIEVDGDMPQPVSQAGYSEGHAQAELRADIDMEVISGISRDFQGQPSGAESGVQTQLRIQRSQIGVFQLFDNFRITKIRLGRLIMSRIGQFWDAAQIQRVVGRQRWSQNPEYPEAASRMAQGDIQWDVTIDETISSPTYRAAVMEMLANASKSGLPVPPEALVEQSELPSDQKKRIIELIQFERQLRAQEAAQQPGAGQPAKGGQPGQGGQGGGGGGAPAQPPPGLTAALGGAGG